MSLKVLYNMTNKYLQVETAKVTQTGNLFAW